MKERRRGKKERKEKKKNEQARIEKGIIPCIFAYMYTEHIHREDLITRLIFSKV